MLKFRHKVVDVPAPHGGAAWSTEDVVVRLCSAAFFAESDPVEEDRASHGHVRDRMVLLRASDDARHRVETANPEIQDAFASIRRTNGTVEKPVVELGVRAVELDVLVRRRQVLADRLSGVGVLGRTSQASSRVGRDQTEFVLKHGEHGAESLDEVASGAEPVVIDLVRGERGPVALPVAHDLTTDAGAYVGLEVLKYAKVDVAQKEVPQTRQAGFLVSGRISVEDSVKVRTALVAHPVWK